MAQVIQGPRARECELVGVLRNPRNITVGFDQETFDQVVTWEGAGSIVDDQLNQYAVPDMAERQVNGLRITYEWAPAGA